jgi:hypothetical protein
MTLHKYLGPATLLTVLCLSGGCRSTIIHKDGAAHVAKEAVKPITESLDKQTDKLIEKLKLEELSSKLNEIANNLQKITTPPESPPWWHWQRILPILLIIIGVLSAVFIFIKKGKRNVSNS